MIGTLLGAFKFPKSTPEIVAHTETANALEAEFTDLVERLEEAAETCDFRAVQHLLEGWKFPKHYPEFKKYTDKASAIEADFEEGITHLEGAVMNGDFRALRQMRFEGHAVLSNKRRFAVHRRSFA